MNWRQYAKGVNRMSTNRISRRTFIKSTGAAALALGAAACTTTGVARARRVSPNEKLNIAGIGVGNMGAIDLAYMEDENIVALCDVDWDFAARTFRKYPKAKKYKDFRVMLDKQRDIDAVVIATPDHTHAIATMAAIRRGKHVYCQKPLTHSIYEARKVTEAARESGVVTQMGIQNHEQESHHMFCEWIWDGAIGDVYEVHLWTSRPSPPWSCGMRRPTETPPVPKGLDWDLWLGPALYRPYHPIYHPDAWRGWWDFGCGALGDMGCHFLDPVKRALKLTAPTSVEASYSTHVPNGFSRPEPKNLDTYPRASLVTYRFPAREGFPPLKLMWYDGGLMPPRPEELEDRRRMGNEDGGMLYVGTKGKILANSDSIRLIPESRMKEYKRPPKTLPRSIGHRQEWIQACKGNGKASTNFDYAGPLTETVLLGNVAIRTDKKLHWDSENFRITNVREANEHLHREYREGWVL